MDTVKRGLCSEKAKVNWNEKKRNGAQSAVGLVQIYLDKTVSTVKHGAFAMYMVRALLLHFSVKVR